LSEIKLISPLLDNIDVGDAISDRNGVRACPAMEKDSSEKYILKVVSTPSTPAQLDALILSGAFQTKEDALSYYKEVSDSVIEEAKLLEKLSGLEGFVSYKSCQLEPMEDGNGFDVYLLSPYRKSLERIFKTSSMTHLNALNLGLDLCAALSVCRRCGYLYVALKPANIYQTGDNAFKIGDIGFIKLDSLKYASLPERYRSRYTAPEIEDAYAALNTTIDVYAVGLILYQAFNGGILPEEAEGSFPPPDYADYEIAEIILKACAADPADRWQDPIELGQAIVSYIQRNGAHDKPIVPLPTTELTDESEPVSDETVDISESNEVSDESLNSENIPDTDDSEASDETMPQIEEGSSLAFQEIEIPLDPSEEITEPESNDTIEATNQLNNEPDKIDTVSSDEEFVDDKDIEQADSTDENIYSEDDFGNITFLSTENDETLPGDEECNEDVEYDQLSVEVSDMLSQADELIAHPTPEPVVAPEAIEITIPEPESLENVDAEHDSEDETKATDESAEESPIDNSDISENIDTNSSESDDASTQYANAEKKPRSHWFRNTLIVLLLLGILAGGFYFYKFYYLQTIDSIELDGKDQTLTVIVNSEVNEALLSVICADTYGNQLVEPVKDGKAVFEGLPPNAAFTVRVDISGFHRLTGSTSTAYTTPEQTKIMQLNAVTGSEDGSVILSFTVEGRDSDEWKALYYSDSEEAEEVVFSSHMCTLNGLTIGTEYTFEVQPASNLNYTGTNTLKHTASKLIRPTDLTVKSCLNGILEASWNAPADTTVSNWTVHCYNENGFDKTIVTDIPFVAIEGIKDADPYTVEVTAAGMSVSERVYVPENSITVKDLSVKEFSNDSITITWNVGNTSPANGWLIRYTIDGSAMQEISTQDLFVQITPYVPDSVYTIDLLTADGESVLGGHLEYSSEVSTAFSGYGVPEDGIGFNMCRTPSYSGWDRYDLDDSDFTTSFEPGEKASFLVRLYTEYDVSSDEIVTLYVIRDENGSLISTSTQTGTWSSMWYRNYGEFDLPELPTVPGNYSITIYFNNAKAGQESFTITE